MSGSGDAVGGGGAVADATGTAEGGSEATGGGQTNLYPVFAGTEQSYDGFEVREVEALPIDYTTMSGADFQRAVGVDPKKWAEAFVRRTGAEMSEAEIAERVAYIAGWFRDAMDAARKDRWLPCQPVSTSS